MLRRQLPVYSPLMSRAPAAGSDVPVFLYALDLQTRSLHSVSLLEAARERAAAAPRSLKAEPSGPSQSPGGCIPDRGDVMNRREPQRTADAGPQVGPRDPDRGGRPSEQTPIFVVGAPRSGTTLLYHLLIRSTAFPVYMAESKLMACAEHYGPLTGRNRNRFLTHFLNSRQFARSGLLAAEFAEEVRRSAVDYGDVLRILMDDIARSQGKDRWVEKTPNHLRYLGKLSKAFPTSKFIHLIRDGRDVALSLRKLGWTHDFGGNPLLQIVAGAKLWEAGVLHGRRAGRRLEGRYLEVRYEDLVTDHEATLRRLAEFAEIGPEMESFAADQSDALKSPNTAFSAPMQGISDEAVGRWTRRLTVEERSVLIYAIGDALAELGYPVESAVTTPSAGLRLFALIYPFLDRVRAVLKSRTSLRRSSQSPLEIGLE